MIYLLHYFIYPVIAMMFVISITSALKLVIENKSIFTFVYFLITFISIAIFSAFVTDDIKIVVAQSIEILSLSLMYFTTFNLWGKK